MISHDTLSTGVTKAALNAVSHCILPSFCVKLVAAGAGSKIKMEKSIDLA